jgi:hypothetical protein
MVNSALSLPLEHHSTQNLGNNRFFRVSKHFVTLLSTRKCEFEPGTFNVGFAVDMVEMAARYFSQFIGSSLQCNFIKAAYSKVIHFTLPVYNMSELTGLSHNAFHHK